MADFIMTLDSDDEEFSLPSTSSKPSLSKQQQRKQQDKASKQKQKLKKRQQKSKKVLDVDLSDQQSSDEEAEIATGFEGVGKMDKGFVFDGLGGGFVGDRRNNVWVSHSQAFSPFSITTSLMIPTLFVCVLLGFGGSLYSIKTQRNGESAHSLRITLNLHVES